MKHTIILLNGPPGCGKDTLANLVVKLDREFLKANFAFPLKSVNQTLFSLTDEQVEVLESDRRAKESPQDILFGKSWREVNILLAEKLIKPEYGKDAFGKLFIKRLKKSFPRVPKNGFQIVISDCGFSEEIGPLIETFGVNNIHLVKIQRKGCDYKNDSRNYVDGSKLGIQEHYLQNNTKLDDFLRDGFTLIKSIKQGNPIKTKKFTPPTSGANKKTSTKEKSE